MERSDENRSLGNWFLARNFLKNLFWPLFLRVDCSQSQDASIKPLCRVCSQKLKFLWPTVAFFEPSEYHLSIHSAYLAIRFEGLPIVRGSCANTNSVALNPIRSRFGRFRAVFRPNMRPECLVLAIWTDCTTLWHPLGAPRWAKGAFRASLGV